MDQVVFGSTLVIIFVAVLALIIAARFIPIGLWITAYASGVRLSFLNLFGMRFRNVNPSPIGINRAAMINARTATKMITSVLPNTT